MIRLITYFHIDFQQEKAKLVLRETSIYQTYLLKHLDLALIFCLKQCEKRKIVLIGLATYIYCNV